MTQLDEKLGWMDTGQPFIAQIIKYIKIKSNQMTIYRKYMKNLNNPI